jgi:hypothetical protein
MNKAVSIGIDKDKGEQRIRRHGTGAGVLLLLGLVAVPGIASAQVRIVSLGAAPIRAALPDGARLDNALIRDPGGEIDVVYGGARFHVPDPGTLTSMHFDTGKMIQLKAGQLQQIGTIPVNGTLLRDRQTGEIDVVVDGKRYHIPDPATFNARGFGGKPVHELWAGGLNQIPEAAWPAPLTGHPAGAARDVADPSAMPAPRTIQASGEISGPVCPNGGHVDVQVQLVPSPGKVTVQVHAKGTNYCITDDLGPNVVVKLLDENGNRVADQLSLDLPKVPARGFSGPTVREADTSLELTGSLDVANVQVSYQNRFHGNWFVSMIESPVFWEIVGTVVTFFTA